MYLSVGQEPPSQAEAATATAFSRAAIGLLGSSPGPFGLVAMTPDLGVRVIAQPATQAAGESLFAARKQSNTGDLFVGLFRRDEDAPKGWWVVSVEKLHVAQSVGWALPLMAAAMGIGILWMAGGTTPRGRR